jgi:hypothetical protein
MYKKLSETTISEITNDKQLGWAINDVKEKLDELDKFRNYRVADDIY